MLEIPVTDNERQLVSHCLADDPVALQAFVEQFQGMVFSLCFRMLGHRQDAEDVTQIVFLRALRNLHTWDSSRPLKPWLFTIAANRCRTHLVNRTRQPRIGLANEPPAPIDGAPGNLALAEELQLALMQLPEQYRLCFVLHHQQELNLQTISEILDCPLGTIKTWLYRARRELADILERRGLAPQVNHELPRI